MKFNIWTFLFQIINFFVLLFILKRLLFKPVREIMEKRRGLIAETLGAAENTKKEAEELGRKNQEEMRLIKEERISMMEAMKTEIHQEKERLIAGARKEAEKIIEKEKALFDMEMKRAKSELRDAALDAVTIYTSQILRDIADEALNAAVSGRVMKDASRISAGIRDRMGTDKRVTVELASAYPVKEADLTELREVLETEINSPIDLQTTTNPGLIAGITLRAYDMVYDLSLSGQIRAFSAKLREKA